MHCILNSPNFGQVQDTTMRRKISLLIEKHIEHIQQDPAACLMRR